MKFRSAAVALCGSLLVLTGCGGAEQAAPVTVTVPTTVVSAVPTTVAVTVTTTFDPSAAAASSSAASVSSVAANGGAEFQSQLAAAGLTSPSYDQAVGYCKYMDAGKDPFQGAGGILLGLYSTVLVSSADKLKGLQITVATLCPQHQSALDAAIQKRADAATAAQQQSQVTYSVTGSDSGSASVTYSEDANFNIAQETAAVLPWTKDLTIPAGTSRILSLNAQNSGGGDISCSISVAGKVVDTGTSSGDYRVRDVLVQRLISGRLRCR